MSQWTTENAIFRDLSVVQGRVPVAIEGTLGLGAKDKPPSLNITEETEEEFFKYGCADADVAAAPDCGHIMQMLDMVRDIDVLSDDDDGKVIVISKLNPLTAEFVPNVNNTSTPLSQSPKKVKENNSPPLSRSPKNVINENTSRPLCQSSKNVKGNDNMNRPLNQSSKTVKGNDNTCIPLSQSSKNVKGNDDTSRPLSQPSKNVNRNEKTPKKRQRNIAVESILQAIADNKQNNEPEVLILLKPNDFIKLNEIAEEEKVRNKTKLVENDQPEKIADQINDESKVIEINNDDNKSQNGFPAVEENIKCHFTKTKTESPFPKRTPKVTLVATNMFKRKSATDKMTVSLEATNMFKRKSATEKVTNVEVNIQNGPAPSNGEYKPSTLANEYYQKYVERIKFKESVKDDIWTKAEKKMKEIDEKRKRELAEAFASPSTSSEASDDTSQSTEDTQSILDHTRETKEARIKRCLDMISLPQHRHHLTGDCIVCSVLKKKPENQSHETESNEMESNEAETN